MAAPSTAQISIMVSGKQVWVNPPNFLSLSMERLAGDTCNKFVLQVLDTSAFDLEYALLNNTGGNISFSYNDYSGNVFKTFSGYVLKMSDNFVDNRVMLRVEGFVGVSFQDKFDKISFAWNVVPKFDWGNIFTDANTQSGGINQDDQNEDDGFFENIGNWFKNFGGQAWAGLSVLISSIKGDDLTYRLLGADPEGSIQAVIDNLKVDQAGNYYLPNRQMSNQYDIDDTTKSKNVKQTGSIVVPMRPSNIIKIIGKGGAYADLLESDFENYKGTNFYNGSNKVSKLDWLFIKLWFKKMGRFKGCGWKVSDANIQKTDIKQADFTQTKQSFLQYINKVLIPNSTTTETTEKTVTKENGKQYKQTINTIRSNFLLSFDSDGTVYYKRLNITNTPTVQATYYVYGNGSENIQKPSHGHLTSFSANLDVLTSMITAGVESGGDISNLNLVTGEQNADYQIEADPNDEKDLTAFTDWGSMKVTVSKGSSSTSSGQKSLTKIQEEALAQCYTAEATIEGPCKLSPQDYIKICVIPRSETGGVLYHHTSGNYYILEIDENIEGGRQYSSLKLVKNVGSMGNTGETTEVVDEKEIVYALSSNRTITQNQIDSNNPNKVVIY